MSEDSSSIIDVTEAAARPNELVLRAVVQSSPLAIVVLDRRGTIHVWNRAAEELLGWPAADVVGCRPPFVARDLASDLDDLVACTLRGDAVKGMPGQYVARDGRAVDVDVSMAPLHGPSGRAIGVVAVLAEVTARAAAAEVAGEREARLLELEEAYRAVIELRTARLTSVDAGPGEQAAARPDAISPRHAAGSAVVSTVQQAIDGGELRLFFQPIVRLDDARCVGAEALVRWQHPERGLDVTRRAASARGGRRSARRARGMGPRPRGRAGGALAARTGRLRGDASTCRRARRRSPASRIGSRRRSIGTASRPRTCASTFPKRSCPPAGAGRGARVEELHAVGVAIALDDFGTGCTTSADLERLGVAAVKIDRGLVADLVDDAGNRAIVAAVVGLAHSLGCRAVGAGVETEAQLRALLDLGCDEAQGYFFAPPQPAADLRALVSATRRWRPPGSRLMDGP